MSIQKDFEDALAEADPSLPLCECPRWVQFQALSPEHGDFFAGYMLAMRGRIDTSTPERAAGAAYAARQEAG